MVVDWALPASFCLLCGVQYCNMIRPVPGAKHLRWALVRLPAIIPTTAAVFPA